MTLHTDTASALVWAIERAREHGGAAAALAAAGLELPEIDCLDGLSDDVDELVRGLPGHNSVREALALGVLAGRVADRPARARRLQDPTSFLISEDLVVQDARGQSILRLPWAEEGLFVGRQLPDITEIPAPVRRLCVENYTAALAGERGRFSFTSYGHSYTVDAVPVRDENGRIEAVLAVAVPAHNYAAAVSAHLRTAARLDHSAELAEERAERYPSLVTPSRSSPNCTERGLRAGARREPGRARSACRYASLPNPELPRRSRRGRPRCSALPPTASRRLRLPSRSASAPPPSERTSTTSTAGSARTTDALRSRPPCVTDSSTSRLKLGIHARGCGADQHPAQCRIRSLTAGIRRLARVRCPPSRHA